MKIFGYGRASTNKQQITGSKQKEIVESAVELKQMLQWQDSEYVGWFYDEAISGTEPFLERPMGQKILLNAQAGDIVVISHLDRAFRSVVDCANAITTMNEAGIEICILDAQVDTSTPVGRACLKMIALMKELEVEEIRRRTKEAAQHVKSKRGFWTTTPIGWRKVGMKANSRMVPCHHIRRIAQFVEQRHDAGVSFRDIIPELRKRDFRWPPYHRVRANQNIESQESVSQLYYASKMGFPQAPFKEAIAAYRENA